jgi:hypothetical protein
MSVARFFEAAGAGIHFQLIDEDARISSDSPMPKAVQTA